MYMPLHKNTFGRLHSAQCTTVYSALCTVHSAQCTLHSAVWPPWREVPPPRLDISAAALARGPVLPLFAGGVTHPLPATAATALGNAALLLLLPVFLLLLCLWLLPLSFSVFLVAICSSFISVWRKKLLVQKNNFNKLHDLNLKSCICTKYYVVWGFFTEGKPVSK